jgi:hypothetical protein
MSKLVGSESCLFFWAQKRLKVERSIRGVAGHEVEISIPGKYYEALSVGEVMQKRPGRGNKVEQRESV